MMKCKALTLILAMAMAPAIVLAGSLDSPAAPDSTSSYTLEDIYNRLNTGAAATQSAFTEPTAGPGSTGHTLNDIYELTEERAFVPKTGQTSSYATGDDGDLEKGVSSPTQRFTDNGDGTVTDHLTGLIWLENGDCGETVGGVTGPTMTWADALTFCDNLAHGDCGLSDGSSAGDWRLANRKELLSLIDLGQYNPAMPAGHPFTVISNWYWSSSSYASYPDDAWYVYFYYGGVYYDGKGHYIRVRAVRGGQ